MSSTMWDQIGSDAGEFVKFDQVGDSVVGVVTDLGVHTFASTATSPERTVPQLHLRCEDGTVRTLTAGQVRLRVALGEQRPEVGDRLAVKLTQIEPRGGGKTLKHFDVRVKRDSAPPTRTRHPTPTAAATAGAAGPAVVDEPPF